MSSWYKLRPCLWNVQPKDFLGGIKNLSHVLNATFDNSGFKNKFHISCHQTVGRAWIQGLEKTRCKVQSCVKSFDLGSDSVSSTPALEVLGYRGEQSGCSFTWNYGSAVCLEHGLCNDQQTMWVKKWQGMRISKREYIFHLPEVWVIWLCKISLIPSLALFCKFHGNSNNATMGIPGTTIVHAIITAKSHFLIWI